MTFIFLSLAATLGIFIIFKNLYVRKISLTKAVTINYLFCTLTGLLFHFQEFARLPLDTNFSWFPFSIMLGALFIFSFFLIGKTTAEYGISVVSISTKVSLIIPVLLSIFWLKSVDLNFYLLAALVASIPTIVLISLKKGEKKEIPSLVYLPITVFFLTGIIDGGINTLSFYYSDSHSFIFFPETAFFFAGLFGILFYLLKTEGSREWKRMDLWISGAALGFVNFFSIEFLIRGLEDFNHNGALVFPFLNVGIIFFSSLLGRGLFKEKLSNWNLVGLALAIICLGFLVISALPNF
jgi:drug/metabolite transporter (DMT)-like permease